MSSSSWLFSFLLYLFGGMSKNTLYHLFGYMVEGLSALPHDRIDNVLDWAHTRGTAHVIGHACYHAKQAGGTYG